MPHRRRGFTLVELIVVIVILGLLSGIAILKYLDLRNTARAAEVTGDFRSIMVGAYNYHADAETWPPDGAAGTVPPALAPYLPSGFTFSKGYYTLDYENLGLGGGAYMIGVTVTSPDPDLIQKLIRNLGTRAPFFAAGGSLTYIIVGSDGRS